MNIALDVSPLKSGHKGRGVGVYTKALLESLETYQPRHKILPFDDNRKISPAADIVHYPYFDPFFFTLPLIKHKPTVVTVHDLIPLVYPGHFPPGLRGAARWQVQRLSLLGSRRILTDSGTSKDDIVRITGYRRDRIDTIYLAPSIRKLSADTVDKTQIRKLGLPEKYFLYVGDVNWNKNVPGLIRAYNKYVQRQQASPACHLVLVGGVFTDMQIHETREIAQLIRSLRLQAFVHMPGFVPESDLPIVFGRAICLVSPSFYEGFGFSVVDAFSCGCPVIASKAASLGEIGGPSVRVDPNNDDEIADSLEFFTRMSVSDRGELISKGKSWVSRFTWQKVATETISSYTKAIS